VIVPNLAFFIDGAEFSEAQRALGVQADYRKLRYAFHDRGRLVRAYFYPPADEGDLTTMRPLLDWLAYNGYEVREPDRGQRRRGASMAVELAVDVMQLTPHLDTVILFSGDDIYKPLVGAVQAAGKRVVVVSTLELKSVSVGGLRRQADEFLDIADMLPAIKLERPRRADESVTA
jgi:uncharacterized LabA/DUF88 family protein